MKWSGFCLLATLAVLCLLDGHKTSAAPSPRTDDLLKTLQDLEQIYSSMARPRFGKRDRLINNNGIYRSAESDYADDQSNDDGHVPVADGMGSDAEMRSVSERIRERDDASPSTMRHRQLQKLPLLYHYQLN
ncbi:uncharacterized protein [Atheta coriaria]|uniref:uncharacterized protein isoform X2 n=1 Tax=Dalotia coriaria TaxID=877792 RepID=UPI0031F44FA0